MTLGALINKLEEYPREQVVVKGFKNPHSYRGYYEQLAFEPADNTTVGEMLDSARSALGETFPGWKGGDFEMGEYTDCHLANWGKCGEEMGPVLLGYMLGEYRP